MLRETAKKLLPPSVLERKKMGFTIPLPEWFRSGLRGAAEDCFFATSGGASGLIDPGGLRRMWYEHQLGVRDHSTVFWSLLMFEKWVRRFLGAEGALRPVPDRAQPTRVSSFRARR